MHLLWRRDKHVLLFFLLSTSSLKLTGRRINHKISNISLRSTGNHNIDEIFVIGCINDRQTWFLRLKFRNTKINCNTALFFSLKLIKNSLLFESKFTHFACFFLGLSKYPFFNNIAFINELSSWSEFIKIKDRYQRENSHLIFIHFKTVFENK